VILKQRCVHGTNIQASKMKLNPAIDYLQKLNDAYLMIMFINIHLLFLIQGPFGFAYFKLMQNNLYK
jgi:hypothetical protein